MGLGAAPPAIGRGTVESVALSTCPKLAFPGWLKNNVPDCWCRLCSHECFSSSENRAEDIQARFQRLPPSQAFVCCACLAWQRFPDIVFAQPRSQETGSLLLCLLPGGVGLQEF